MNESEIRNLLNDLNLSEIKYFESISSTNTAALEMAENGAADFGLVIANNQTAGRGRFNRRWVTNPDSALAFSLILRPNILEIEHLGLFSPLGALAVCDGLSQLGLTGQIKWPNDVLLNHKKVCGILAESVWLGSQVQAVVIGIGVNVAPDSVPPTDQLLFPATSVEGVLQSPVNRYHLLKDILRALCLRRAHLLDPGFLKDWNERLAFRGKQVRLKRVDEEKGLIGKVVGIDPNGNLLLLGHDGKILNIAVGEIHLRPESEGENDSLGGCAC